MQTSCLANASEECKKAAYYAEQDLKRVEMEKEVLVKDYNVMAARQEQEVVRKKEVEGRLMEVEKVKHELQKQIEVRTFVLDLSYSVILTIKAKHLPHAHYTHGKVFLSTHIRV